MKNKLSFYMCITFALALHSSIPASFFARTKQVLQRSLPTFATHLYRSKIPHYHSLTLRKPLSRLPQNYSLQKLQTRTLSTFRAPENTEREDQDPVDTIKNIIEHGLEQEFDACKTDLDNLGHWDLEKLQNCAQARRQAIDLLSLYGNTEKYNCLKTLELQLDLAAKQDEAAYNKATKDKGIKFNNTGFMPIARIRYIEQEKIKITKIWATLKIQVNQANNSDNSTRTKDDDITEEIKNIIEHGTQEEFAIYSKSLNTLHVCDLQRLEQFAFARAQAINWYEELRLTQTYISLKNFEGELAKALQNDVYDRNYYIAREKAKIDKICATIDMRLNHYINIDFKARKGKAGFIMEGTLSKQKINFDEKNIEYELQKLLKNDPSLLEVSYTKSDGLIIRLDRSMLESKA